MTITGLLDPGAAEIVDRRTGELLGYVFTVANGKGQLQRWLLFRHPQNELEIRPPPASMASWALTDWQANVPSLWRPNGFYVWAQADVYRHGGTYGGVTWNQIPARLPSPTFPERPGSNYQLDWTGKIADVLQDDWRGRAFVVRGLTKESSIEYWSLPAEYQPAGGSRAVAVVVAVGVEEATSLDAFVEVSNRTWSAGSTFVITGCANYHGVAPPFAP